MDCHLSCWWHSTVRGDNRTWTEKIGDGGQRARCLNLRCGEVCVDFCAAVVNDRVKVMAMEVCHRPLEVFGATEIKELRGQDDSWIINDHREVTVNNDSKNRDQWARGQGHPWMTETLGGQEAQEPMRDTYFKEGFWRRREEMTPLAPPGLVICKDSFHLQELWGKQGPQQQQVSMTGSRWELSEEERGEDT